jgi:hypothetical protein
MPPQPAGRAAAVANGDTIRDRFKRARASRYRRLAGTNDNPVLIAVLAAAFIGERMTPRRTIWLLMGVARAAGGHRGHRTGGPRRCRPRAARQQRPRSRASTRGRRCGRCRGLPRRLRRLVRHAVRWRRGADDRRRRRVGVNHLASDTTILTASGKGPVPPRIRGRARPARL